MFRVLVSFSVLLFILSVNGQGVVTFTETSFNFGKFKEDLGLVNHPFILINHSSKSVRILAVKTTCGCTTTGWNQEPILSGDTAFIEVRYNPINRPGKFKKNLIVSLDNNSQQVLTIEGYVEPKIRSVSDRLGTEMGNLMVQNRSLSLGKVTNDKPFSKSFEVLNKGTQSLIFYMDQVRTVPYISIGMDLDTLGSGAVGVMSISFDPIAYNKLGFSSQSIVIPTNDPLLPEKEFFVISTVEEYFPPMTETQLKNAPKLMFDKSLVDFGPVNSGTELSTIFLMMNTGKSELIIRDIQTNCGCTAAKVSSYKIKPGDQAELVVVFNPRGRNGRQYKSITVFSNDPSAPSQLLTIKAEL